MVKFPDTEFPELDFKRGSKKQSSEDFHRLSETLLLNMGGYYAKIYKEDKDQFRFMFINYPSVQRACGLIYWAYRLHNLVEEVEAEEGERRERLFARRIKKVFEEIMSEETSGIKETSGTEQQSNSK